MSDDRIEEEVLYGFAELVVAHSTLTDVQFEVRQDWIDGTWLLELSRLVEQKRSACVVSIYNGNLYVCVVNVISQAYELADPNSFDGAITLIEHALRTPDEVRYRRGDVGWTWDEVVSTPYRYRRRSLGLVRPGPATQIRR